MASLTQQFVERLWDFSWPTVGAEARHATKSLLRDHIAVVAAGSRTESAKVMRKHLERWPSRMTALDTAIASAVAGHSMEFDDVHCPASLHPGVVVFPTAYAVSRIQRVSEACVLTAVVRGYEAMCRIGRALNPAAHYARHFHPTATAGTFAATIVASTILDLDRSTTVAALGIAASLAAGSMEFLTDGVWTKRLHPAFALRHGLEAALLARDGVPGPSDGIAGERGFLNAYSAKPLPTELLCGFGSRKPEICATSIKPYSCCRYVQAPIDAVLSVRKSNGFQPDAVRSVRLGIPSVAVNIIAEPAQAKRHPKTIADAQFSAPFGAAVALLTGRAGIDEYSESMIASPRIRDLMQRVTCVVDADLDRVFPAEWRGWAEITTEDGSSHRNDVAAPRGDPANPLNDKELDEKFHRLLSGSISPDMESQLLAALASLGEEGALDAVFASAGWS